MTKLWCFSQQRERNSRSQHTNLSMMMMARSKQEQRLIVSHALMQYVDNGRLNRGAFKAVAERTGISTRAVERIWQRFRKSILDPVAQPLDVSRKKGSGRPRKISMEELRAAIKEIPFSQRTTFRSTAAALKIPLSTL